MANLTKAQEKENKRRMNLSFAERAREDSENRRTVALYRENEWRRENGLEPKKEL